MAERSERAFGPIFTVVSGKAARPLLPPSLYRSRALTKLTNTNRWSGPRRFRSEEEPHECDRSPDSRWRWRSSQKQTAARTQFALISLLARSLSHLLVCTHRSWLSSLDCSVVEQVTRVCDCIDLMSCSTNGVSSSSNAAGRVGLLAIQIYYPPAYVRQTELGTRHGAIP